MAEARTYLQVFTNRRAAAVGLLGFSSGLPFMLTASTLQAWMTVEGVDVKTLGLFALVGLPYTLKFIWSPVMDRFRLPWLSRRRGWILLMQILLAAGIGVMAFVNPSSAATAMAGCAVAVAFLSASQDIVIDAYRTDILPAQERGAGAAVGVMGYRIAMLVSGALALVLSEAMGWRNTYLLMAALMLAATAVSGLGPDPQTPVKSPASFRDAVVEPLKDYFSRRHALAFLLIIILYKLGDSYAGSLTTAFLIRGVGFTPGEVGAVNKAFGMAATIVGALVGGGLMVRLGLFRSLLWFGVLQAVPHLLFMVLAWTGRNWGVFLLAVGFENLSGGMGTAALVALCMTLCNPRFSATQYAVLSSVAALGRALLAPTAGYLVAHTGWAWFFFVSMLFAAPGLGLLWWFRLDVQGAEGAKPAGAA